MLKPEAAPYINAFHGTIAPPEPIAGSEWGVAILDLTEPAFRVPVPEMVEFEAASINKLAIAYAFNQLHPEGKLAEEVRVTDEDRRPGGLLQYAPTGYSLPLGRAVELSLAKSDNTATRILVRAAGGPLAVNKVLEDPSSELFNTRLKPSDNSDDSPEALYEMGVTTPAESAMLLQRALTVPAHAHALEHGMFRDGLRRIIDESPRVPNGALLSQALEVGTRLRAPRLPAAFFDKLLSQQAPLTLYPNKHGRLPGIYHDVCKVGNRVVAVLSRNHSSTSDQLRLHPALPIFGAIGEAVQNGQPYIPA